MAAMLVELKDMAAMLVELKANEESFVIILQHSGNDVITCKRSTDKG